MAFGGGSYERQSPAPRGSHLQPAVGRVARTRSAASRTGIHIEFKRDLIDGDAEDIPLPDLRRLGGALRAVGRGRNPAAAKAALILRVCGTTEVVPCHKAQGFSAGCEALPFAEHEFSPPDG